MKKAHLFFLEKQAIYTPTRILRPDELFSFLPHLSIRHFMQHLKHVILSFRSVNISPVQKSTTTAYLGFSLFDK